MVFTVVHHYFKRNNYRQDKKRLQKILFFSGFPDARSIRLPSSYLWKDMGNTVATQEKADAQPQTQADEKPDARGTFQLASLKKVKNPGCCTRCCEILFIVLCILCMLKSVAEIIVAICTAISTRLFNSEQSGRLVGMVFLALLAAVTISILVYALIAVFKKQERPLHAAAIVLLLVAILQGVVVGLGVRMTADDEIVLVQSLEDSFKLAREENSRHVQLWSSTQSELSCCGVNGPADYSSITTFGPNVPISCCPNYDSSRSLLVQEREREICKARKTYYVAGCEKLVVESVMAAAKLVVGLTCSLMVLEIILAIQSLILLSKLRHLKSEQSKEMDNNA